MERVGIQPLKCPKISNSLSKKVTEFSSGETYKNREKNGLNPKGVLERERGNQIVGRQGTAGEREV